MKKIGIFYGSSTGTTEDIAQRIADKLGVQQGDIHNVGDADVQAVTPYDVLILGTSTWGVGDLQDDWEDFLPKLKKQDLSGKAVAFFGTGDCSSFSDSFCDAMGALYTGLQQAGCSFCGAFSVDGYSYDDSTAVVDGQWVGLAIDEINESFLTDSRIAQWAEELSKAL
ncbi:MAG: flavodoxin FldA [Tannerellaceae bacterium]|jgi:flavodoxin I|nr:flavodoxin FldA [Tannerellaceae bacterium]